MSYKSLLLVLKQVCANSSRNISPSYLLHLHTQLLALGSWGKQVWKMALQ